MPRAGFEDWLERRYPVQSTVRARLSNVRRIESFYGSLDDHWRRDRCATLIAELCYSGSDAARGAPNPSRIPIEGDIRNGLLTLRSALGLYCEYLTGAAPGATARRDLTGRQRALRFAPQPPAAVADDGLQAQRPRNDPNVGQAAPTTDRSDLANRSVRDLLALHAVTLDALRSRKVVRSANVVGDYAEWLFARAFGWTLASPSEKSHDALDAAGVRYQVKARRDSGKSGADQLGILRNLSDDGFDALAAVIFNADFSVRFAGLLPRALIAERAVYSDYQRGHILTLSRALLADARVRDVTQELRSAG